MKYATISATAFLLVAVPMAAKAEHRQLGPHVHGHGTLNIAVEGGKVSMELDAPGADIAGFEHKPNSPQEEAQAKAAMANLKDGQKQFVLTPAAQCKLIESKAEIEEEGHHEESKDEHDADHEHEEPGGHNDYNASYIFECTSPDKLNSITFDYFKTFAGAKALTINVVGPNSQGTYEVTREQPVLDLSGRL